MREYGFSMTRILLYTGEYGSLKTRILAYFIQCQPLSCSDWNYDGFYENDLDNDNHKKAKGFNYHQGPVSI